MGKRLILAAAVCFALMVSAISAEAVVKSFIKEYTYQASKLDSKTSCRAIALEQIKRELLDESGTCVESTTAVSDYTLEKDEIRTISAGVVQTRLVDEKWDGKEYWLKAEVSADPFQPKPRLNKADRPLRPAVRRPALERNRKPSVTDPSHTDTTQTIHQPARPAPAGRSLTPDRPRIHEPQRPAMRRPAPVAPGQREDHQPVTKPRIEPLKRKDAQAGQEDKRRKRDGEDQDREKPFRL